MTTLYNFGPGPACLPKEVLHQIREDIPDWYDGISVMEVSHRLPVVMERLEASEKDLRQLLSIPEDFAVLFMHGGARTQFSAIPLNLLKGQTADYCVTGCWSEYSYQEAQKYGAIHCAIEGKTVNYQKIPDSPSWSEKCAYVHYTDNETVHGVEFPHPPDVRSSILVSDMTSNLLTRALDFSRFGLIYASAQKNIGIAGLTVVIVRKDLIGAAHPLTPSTLDYAACYQAHSMQNTPPVFAWYVLGLVLKWTLAQGGCKAFEALSAQKAKLMYDTIDKSDFYQNKVYPPHRSRINVPFYLPTPALEALFLKEASEHGLKQLKGHQLVGGCRASFYNAMPLAGVKALVNFMQDFERRHR